MPFRGVVSRFTATSLGKKIVEFNKEENSYIFHYPCKSSNECSSYELTFSPGVYRIELWGASGGKARYQNVKTIREGTDGKGAYVSGVIHFIGTTKLYLFIGGKGEDQTDTSSKLVVSLGGFNGGGNGGVDLYDPNYRESGAGGGGSTDLRLINDNSLRALKSRLIVAGAGGGGVSANHTENIANPYGGSGGCLSGEVGQKYRFPGNQTFGVFGRGADGNSYNEPDAHYGGSTGGNGSGYYGGLFILPSDFDYWNDALEIAGSGGSSYISGHEGCDSVLDDGSDPPSHSGSEFHYMNIFFNETKMLCKGSENFTDPYGEEEDGHTGNGAAKITVIKARESFTMPW